MITEARKQNIMELIEDIQGVQALDSIEFIQGLIHGGDFTAEEIEFIYEKYEWLQ